MFYITLKTRRLFIYIFHFSHPRRGLYGLMFIQVVIFILFKGFIIVLAVFIRLATTPAGGYMGFYLLPRFLLRFLYGFLAKAKTYPRMGVGRFALGGGIILFPIPVRGVIWVVLQFLLDLYPLYIYYDFYFIHFICAYAIHKVFISHPPVGGYICVFIRQPNGFIRFYLFFSRRPTR